MRVEAANSGDDRHSGPAGECREALELNVFSVALKLEILAVGVVLAARRDVTSHETNIDVLNVHVGPGERGARGHALQRLAAELTWSKTQIRAAIHRAGNAVNLDVTRQITLCAGRELVT